MVTYLFRTAKGRLGMIWTSWIYNVYTQGVAYSESGTLDGRLDTRTEAYNTSRLWSRYVVSNFGRKMADVCT